MMQNKVFVVDRPMSRSRHEARGIRFVYCTPIFCDLSSNEFWTAESMLASYTNTLHAYKNSQYNA
jgi:hypothetical protein